MSQLLDWLTEPRSKIFYFHILLACVSSLIFVLFHEAFAKTNSMYQACTILRLDDDIQCRLSSTSKVSWAKIMGYDTDTLLIGVDIRRRTQENLQPASKVWRHCSRGPE